MDTKLMQGKARLNYLDIYKGICILFVVITHYDWTDFQRRIFLFYFWITMAVPIFMVITGYVSALSFQTRSINLKTIYSPREIICKWIRFIVPFIPIFITLSITRIFLYGQKFTFIEYAKQFIKGGYGPGSYYFPVMLQVVIIFPVIWYIIKKFTTKGLIGCFIINVLYEGFKTLIDMDPSLYRLCSLRYFFILAYGCYLYVIQHEKRAERELWYDIVGRLGAAYIIIFVYTEAVPIITNQWTWTSVFAVLFLVPIMMRLMRPNRLHNRILELLGKASYNICLMQMLYYWGFADIIYNYVPNIIIRLIINIMICCILGVIFYKIESPITQRIINRIKNI